MDAPSPFGADTPSADAALTAAPAPEEPPTLPGYEAVRAIGRGCAGTVWLVREQGTGRLFAAKLLVPDSGGVGAEEVLARAQKEARISRARPHEHILGVHRALMAEGAGDGTVALLGEYAPGGSLGHLVRVRGRLPVGECITVVAPIAQALAALHAEGSAHGDVSPGNVLFMADGRPVLGDFGLARMVGDAAAAPAGTPGFTDPAAAPPAGTGDAAGPPGSAGRRTAALAAAADVFSLGAVAWFALTGEPPVPTAQRPPLPLMVSGVPAELAAAIEAALRDDPRQRPSAEELARSVVRSGRPAPIDLAPAVEAAVLPELVTRRRDEPTRRRLARARVRRRRRAVPAAGRPRRGGPAAVGSAVAGVVLAAALVWWWAAPPPVRGTGPRADASGQAAASGAARAGWESLPEQLRRAADDADPVQAVQALSEIRARGLAERDRGLLSAVNAAGSEAEAADTELLERLLADGHRLEGFSARVLAASLETHGEAAAGGSQRAVVRVRVVTSGYTVKDRDGATVGERPAGRDQRLTVVMERDAQRWKVARIGPS